MPERDGDLAAMIAQFRESVRERIADNDKFHEDLDGADPMTFLGVTGTEYRIDKHEALVWIDPEGYITEQRAWQDAKDGEEHRLTVEYLSDPDQRPVVRELALAIRRNRIAPFVGSGGSACLNFPTWSKALSDLAVRIATGAEPTVIAECDKAKDAIAAGDLIGAGSLLYAANKTVVDNFVSTTFAVPPDLVLDDVTGITRLLPEVTDGCLITTNFDRLIEMVFEESKKPIEGFMHGSQKLHKFAVNLAKGDRCILKLHGDSDDPDTYIFSAQQYDDAYGNPIDFALTLPRALKQIFFSHSLLFLGCSLEVDRTLEVFETVAKGKEFDVPDHYAIIEDPDDAAVKGAKENRLLEMGIKPIWFPPKDYEMGESILKTAIANARRRVTI